MQLRIWYILNTSTQQSQIRYLHCMPFARPQQQKQPHEPPQGHSHSSLWAWKLLVPPPTCLRYLTPPAPQGHIHQWLLLGGHPVICRPFNVSSCPKANLLGVHACHFLPVSFTTPSFTENWVPQTVRWFIFPVFTSLATFPSRPGQT